MGGGHLNINLSTISLRFLWISDYYTGTATYVALPPEILSQYVPGYGRR